MGEIRDRVAVHLEVDRDRRAAQFRVRGRRGVRPFQPADPRNSSGQFQDPAIIDVIQHTVGPYNRRVTEEPIDCRTAVGNYIGVERQAGKGGLPSGEARPQGCCTKPEDAASVPSMRRRKPRPPGDTPGTLCRSNGETMDAVVTSFPKASPAAPEKPLSDHVRAAPSRPFRAPRAPKPRSRCARCSPIWVTIRTARGWSTRQSASSTPMRNCLPATRDAAEVLDRAFLGDRHL